MTVEASPPFRSKVALKERDDFRNALAAAKELAREKNLGWLTTASGFHIGTPRGPELVHCPVVFWPSVQISQDEGIFEMAAVGPRKTGLSFVVWISPKGYAKHSARVKVSDSPKLIKPLSISVGINEPMELYEGDLSAHKLSKLREWITLNRPALLKYWDAETFTEDVMDELRPVQ